MLFVIRYMKKEGSTFKSFEELKCWKACTEVRRFISGLVLKFPKEEKFALVDNMRRAARSIRSVPGRRVLGAGMQQRRHGPLELVGAGEVQEVVLAQPDRAVGAVQSRADVEQLSVDVGPIAAETPIDETITRALARAAARSQELSLAACHQADQESEGSAARSTV